MKKKVNVFGKGIPVFVIALLGLTLVSAALIGYFGSITGSVIVGQGLFLDGNDWDVPSAFVFEAFTSLESKNFVSAHYLDNEADVDAEVKLDTVCSVSGDVTDNDCVGITSSTEYKLDANAVGACPSEHGWANDDDSIVMMLESSMAWSDFVDVTFDYLIESGAEHTPQMGINMVDGTDVTYHVTWHAKWLDSRLGVVGVEATIVNDKVGNHDLECTDPSTYPCIRCFNIDGIDGAPWTVIPCNTLPAGLTFDRFTINAGDTSYCNDDSWAWGLGGAHESAEQIVWVSNFVVNPTTAIKGIVVKPETLDNPVIGRVDFSIETDFPQMLVPDTYTITTKVVLA